MALAVAMVVVMMIVVVATKKYNCQMWETCVFLKLNQIHNFFF